jgi:hypothetical protein
MTHLGGRVDIIRYSRWASLPHVSLQTTFFPLFTHALTEVNMENPSISVRNIPIVREMSLTRSSYPDAHYSCKRRPIKWEPNS